MVNLTFDIDNRGTDPLEVYGLILVGGDADQFSVISPAAPFTVPIGGTQEVVVQFEGTRLGEMQAALRISSNDFDESTCIIGLSGIGTNDVPDLVVKHMDVVRECGSGSIDISTPYLTSEQFDIVLENNGTTALNVTALLFENGTEFSIFAAPTLPFTVAVGGSTTVTLEFDPTNIGEFFDSLLISSNDPTNSTCYVDLIGTSTDPATDAEIEVLSGANVLVCGESEVTVFSDQNLVGTTTITVSNTGTEDLIVSSAILQGSDAVYFTMTSPLASAFPFAIPPNGTADLDIQIDFAPVAAGNRVADLLIASNDLDEDPCIIKIKGNVTDDVDAPEIVIIDESNLVRECGYTLDFGDIVALDAAAHTIYVENIGATDLILTSMPITGVAANAYTLVSPTAFPITLTPNTRQQLDLEFSGSVVGIYDAVLTLNNNDTDEPACEVNLKGSVATPRIPEIQLVDDTDTLQDCGYTHDFGVLSSGDANPTTVVTIKNLGLFKLNILSLHFSGSGASAFSLVSPPTLPLDIDELSGELDIEIEYDPTASGFGTHSATLHINNSDGDEDPCNILFTGEYEDSGIGDPEIELYVLGTEYQCGDTYDLGQVSRYFDINLEIKNSGTAPLVIDSLDRSGDDPTAIIIGPVETPPIIIPPDSVYFLNVTIVGNGAIYQGNTYTNTVVINNNDTDEPACEFTFTAEIVAPSEVPDIQIENGDRDRVYQCGSTISMDNVVEGTNANVIFPLYIVNSGAGELVIDPDPYFTGADSARFTWVELSAVENEPIEGEVRFNPSGVSAGTYTATFTVDSNDPDEDPCLIDFEITVEGYDLVILDTTQQEVDCKEQVEPGFTLDMGRISQTNTNTKTIYIKNKGTLPATINSIDFVNTPTEYTLTPALPPAVSLAPDEQLAVSITLTPTDLGVVTNQIEITTNDPNLSLCTINVTAEVLDLEVQDLEVSNSGVVIECDGIIDFGEVEASAIGRQSVTLTNRGGASLSVSNLEVSGGDAVLFEIPLGITPLVLLAEFSETSVIRFNPSGNPVGQYSTTLIITSDDPDESPCNITLVANIVDNDPEITYPATCGSSLNVQTPVLNSTDPIQVDTFNFTNTGNGDWIISAINITGDPEHTFAFSPSTFPLTIPSNTALEITVTFDTPNIGFGAYTTEIEIVSNDVSNPSCSYSFNHVKIDETLVPELDLEFEGSSIACGDSITLPQITADVATQEYDLAIINSGTRELSISNMGFDEAEFTLDNPATPFTIAAGDTLDLTITFTHTGQNTYASFLEIQSDDEDESPCIVYFTIIVGEAAAPDLEIQDSTDAVVNCGDTLDFGTFNVGEETQPATELLKFFNVGDAPLEITGISLTGTNAADFGITNLTPPVTINAGNNAIPIVSFNADTVAVGSYSAVLTIQSDDPDENPCVINLIAEVEQPNDAELSLVIDATTLDTPIACDDLIVFDPIFNNQPLQGELIGIGNTGTTNLVLTDAILSGTDAASFSLSPLGTPLTILAGQSSIIQSLTIDPVAVGAGTYDCTVTYHSNDPVNPECAINFTVTVGTPVVQDVQLYDENLNAVNCGSYTLDFGNVDVSQSSTLTIRVENAGTEELTITDIDVLALSGGAFTELQEGQTIAAGAFIDVDITFDPTASGVSTAQLRVFSDDPDEATCTMNLQGNGTVAPELQLQDVNLVDVDCGTFTLELGTTEVGTPTSTSFIIKNSGSSDLTISNMVTTNAEFTTNPSGFPVVISAGNTQTVVVTYDPTGVGVDSDTLTITSDDSDEGTCLVLLNGEGIVTASPDIFIKDGATGYACGALTKDIGQVQQGNSGQTTFTIENVGNGNLNVTDVVSSNGDFTVAPTLFSVPPSGTQLVTVTYTPTSVGAESAVITITSDDADEGSCTVNIDGEGIAALPDIQLEDNNTGQDIACGTLTHDFGSVNVGQSDTFIIEIDNDGLGVLNISSITSDNAVFTVSDATMTIGAGSEQDLTITWTPIAEGTQSATITIVSDDPDESPCTFDVTGNAVGAPDIQLLNMSNTPIACGVMTLSWTGVTSGSTPTQQFQIKNEGTSDLNVTNIVPSDNAWSVNTTNALLVPNATVIITVTYTAGNRGTFNGTLEIFSNDSDENPCIVNLSVDVEGPEIQLQNNNTAQNYDCGAETFDLGIVGINNSNTYVLEIDNDGETTLNITSITSTGSGDFTVSPSNLSIAAGNEQDITITFTPTSLGTKNATFTINSNDYDEAMCSFGVTGIGSGAAEIQMENHLGSDVPCGTGNVIDFGNISNGATTPFTIAIENIGNANLIVTDIEITGTNANAFSLVGGTNYTIGSGSKQNITLQVTPQFVGTHTAVITVDSNDSDENPCSVTLQFGVITNPELQLLDDSLAPVNCGVTMFDWTGIPVGTTTGDFFAIRNDGSTDLTITNITSSDGTIVVSGPNYPVAIGAGSQQIFTLDYTPTANENNSAVITILSDDDDEASCTFNIVATGIAPIIKLQDGQTLNVLPCDSGVSSWGNTPLTDGIIRAFIITNEGDQALTVSSITSSNPDFEIISSINSIPASGVDVFEVKGVMNTLGSHSTTITINSNNVDDSTCTFEINLTATDPEVLRVTDLDNGSAVIDCGSGSINYGQTGTGIAINRNIAVEAIIPSSITASAQISGADADQFIVTPTSTTLNPGSPKPFIVTFNPTSVGVKTATLIFVPTHATGFSPCSITLTGEALGAELSVLQSQGISGIFQSLSCGTSGSPTSLNLGPEDIGDPATVRIKIRNDGAATLQVTEITLISNPLSDYVLQNEGSISSISAGNEEEFQIVFTGSQVGVSNATLRISSNGVGANHDSCHIECTATVS